MQLRLLTTILLIGMSMCYSVDGLWRLEVDDSYTQISSDHEIAFDFHKEIEDGKIVNYLTVYTC